MITNLKLGTPVLVYYRNAIHGGILVSKQTTLEAGEEKTTWIANIDQDGYADGFAAAFASEDVVEAKYNHEMGEFVAEKIANAKLEAKAEALRTKPETVVSPAPIKPQDDQPL